MIAQSLSRTAFLVAGALLVLLILIEVPWRIATWHTRWQLERHPELTENLEVYSEIGKIWSRATFVTEVLRPVVSLSTAIKDAGQWDPLLDYFNQTLPASGLLVDQLIELSERVIDVRDEVSAMSGLTRVASLSDKLRTEPDEDALRQATDLFNESALLLEQIDGEISGLLLYLESTHDALQSLPVLLEGVKNHPNPLLRTGIQSLLESLLSATETIADWMDELTFTQGRMSTDRDVLQSMARVLIVARDIDDWVETTPGVSQAARYVVLHPDLTLVSILLSVVAGLILRSAGRRTVPSWERG